MCSKGFFAMCLAGALTAMPASAQQGLTPGAGSQGPAPEAADKTLGMALMGAVVSSNGSYDPGFSSGVVSTTRLEVGVYRVVFNRSLSGCTPASTAVVTDPPRIVRVDHVATTNIESDTWMVHTFNLAGAPADGAFAIVNFCGR